ncbi:MAG: hypothetical protein L3K00_04915 [Thermoplasmata archaeon]|nr:hypothetical protein [Thermoplasmata archaeon]
MGDGSRSDAASPSRWTAWHGRMIAWISGRLRAPAGTCPKCGWSDDRAGRSSGMAPNCPRCGSSLG